MQRRNRVHGTRGLQSYNITNILLYDLIKKKKDFSYLLKS